MLVTDYSRDSMVQYARQANEAAKALGSTTVAMTNSALIFGQQGHGAFCTYGLKIIVAF